MTKELPMSKLNRRDFLKCSGAATLGAAALSPASLWAGPPAPVLAVAKGQACQPMLEAALAALGGPARLAQRGDRVVLKPTAAWNRAPYLAANTNPDLVNALVRLCLDAGARQVTIFDRTSFRAAFCYHISGLAGAVAEFAPAQVRLVELAESDFVGSGEAGVKVCRWALEADRFINVPQAKHHAQRGVSLGAANLLGAVCGGAPLDGGFLAWALGWLRPSLTVLDATRVLVRNGPAGGHPADVEHRQTLAASADPLAVDAWGCRLLGRDWREFSYFVPGAAAGLGQPDLGRVVLKEV